MKVEDLALWNAFIGVAEHGGFSKAARALRVRVPQLSKQILKLEEILSIRLFQRSTRLVSLTDEGRALLPKVKNALGDLIDVESSLERSGELSGVIRLTCVPYVAHWLLIPILKEFRKLHPKVTFELQLTKTKINLIESGMDMAIRIETPEDSSLVYKKLAANDLVLCASPGYLKAFKNPIQKIEDLNGHELLFMKIHEKCKFSGTKITLDQFSKFRKIESESGAFLTDLALADFGVLVRAIWDVQEHLKKGHLIQVLKNFPIETFGHIYAVIPSKRFLAPRVRAFFDYVSPERFQKLGTKS